jgi:tRNA pseudouridine55 synthase
MDGALILDKPAGLTSHDVVARVRRIIRERRVGHTGTLDPFATGVLVVLVGRATRLAQFLTGAEKEYEATVCLGFATDTGDLTGQPIDQAAPISVRHYDPEEIEAGLASLRGEIDQVPPMYSAKKVQGRKLYELARRGEEIERKPLRVMIHELKSIAMSKNVFLTRNQDGSANLKLRVVCSAGTYVRSLAEVLGQRLGTTAHLAALKRTRAGDFTLSNALTLEALQECDHDNIAATRLLSPDAALSRLSFVHLKAADAERTLHGMPVSVTAVGSWMDGENVRMRREDGRLLAVGRFDADSKTLHPRVVLG